jgi:hypothetical protein
MHLLAQHPYQSQAGIGNIIKEFFKKNLDFLPVNPLEGVSKIYKMIKGSRWKRE